MAVLVANPGRIWIKLTQIKNAIFRRLYYRNPLNLYLGQRIYGNDAGLLANVVGNLAEWRDRLFSTDLNIHSDEFFAQVKQLRENGWARIDNMDFGDALNKLRKKLDDYCTVNEIPDSQRLEISTIGNSNKFFDLFPEAKNILNSELKNFISNYYNSHFRVLNVHLYRIYPVPETLKNDQNYRPYGATACWHNDGSTVESIKLFVLINDVDETQGPMHLIDAAETKKIIKQKKYYRYAKDGLPDSDFERTAKVVKFTGKSGSILLANPNTCLHRASVPLSGKSRDMLVFYLTSDNKPLSENWGQQAICQQSMGFSRLFNRYSVRQ